MLKLLWVNAANYFLRSKKDAQPVGKKSRLGKNLHPLLFPVCPFRDVT
jgi:hypothetical protein